MEKCTYCVQRIRERRDRRRIASRELADPTRSDGVPAGLPDPARSSSGRSPIRLAVVSRAARAIRAPTPCSHELGTVPRTRYLARIRNPNPSRVPRRRRHGRAVRRVRRPDRRDLVGRPDDAELTDAAAALGTWRPPPRLRLALARDRRRRWPCFASAIALHAGHGHRRVGQQHPGRVGVRDHRTSSGGSGSATRARSSRRSCSCSSRRGARRSTASPRR